jgi:hypothetical protein
MFATVKDCGGEVVPPNQVIYRDAFSEATRCLGDSKAPEHPAETVWFGREAAGVGAEASNKSLEPH